MDPMEMLRRYLAGVASGRVADTRELAVNLAPCWDHLRVRAGARIAELGPGVQQAFWYPPILRLIVGAGSGSSQDPEQRWEINVERQTVSQARPSGPEPHSKFNIGGIVDQVVRMTLERRQDPRLRWYSDGSVRIAVGVIFPEGVGFKQTVSSRRRKFRLSLHEKLQAAGWRRLKDYVYAPPSR
jgi:hypothetical protein